MDFPLKSNWTVPVQPAGQLADAAESEPKEKDAAAKPKARKIAAGIAAALCLGLHHGIRRDAARDAVALQTATAALTSIRADYDKVQDVVYHGFVQLDTSQGPCRRQRNRPYAGD